MILTASPALAPGTAGRLRPVRVGWDVNRVSILKAKKKRQAFRLTSGPGGPPGPDMVSLARASVPFAIIDQEQPAAKGLDTASMIRFEDLVEKVRSANPDADVELLRRAYVFSAMEHKGQVRHSGEPYLVHPLEVADILADMRLDAVAIASGLLHDVVEDTLTTIDRIQELFGPEVAHVVEGVTKLSAISFHSKEERQAENFRKMLLAMVDDIRVIMVKLADRLHNMRTLRHMPEEKRAPVAQETLDIYAPIAGRLGMSKMKNELEELAFKTLEPKAHDALQTRVETRRKEMESLVDELKRHDPAQAARRPRSRSSVSTAGSSVSTAFT